MYLESALGHKQPVNIISGEWLVTANSGSSRRQNTATRRPLLLKVTLKVELVPLMLFIVVRVVIMMMLFFALLGFAADSFNGICSGKT